MSTLNKTNSNTEVDGLIKEKFIEYGYVALNTNKQGYNYWIQDIAKLFNGNVEPDKHTLEGHKDVQVVSDKELFRQGDVPWHTDWSYGHTRFDGTILQCVSPGLGTPTVFCNMRDVFRLAVDTFGQEEVDDLFTNNGHYQPPEDLKYCFSPKQWRYTRRNPRKTPLAFTHTNGENYLYFSPGTLTKTDRPFDVDKYVDLLDKCSFQHDWQEGDILIWDNLRFMHKRAPFTGERQLLRIQFKYV